MKTEFISVLEAQNNLAQLLERVEVGDIFIITKNGKEIAKLSPRGGRPSWNEPSEAKKIVIQNGGNKIAKISAEDSSSPPNDLKKANELVDQMEAFQKRLIRNQPDAPSISIRELIEEGRM